MFDVSHKQQQYNNLSNKNQLITRKQQHKHLSFLMYRRQTL